MSPMILDDELGSHHLSTVESVCHVDDHLRAEAVTNLCVCPYDGLFTIVCDAEPIP